MTEEKQDAELRSKADLRRGAFICASFFLSFVAHDALQQAIVSTPGWDFPMVMTLIEFAACVIGPALFERRQLDKLVRMDVPFKAYALLTSVVLGSSYLANCSILLVSYPIKVIFKSCKLLPTMAIGAAFLRKKFGRIDIVSACLLCAGLVGFTAADRAAAAPASADGGEASEWAQGVALLGCAVMLDAVAPNFQEALMRAGGGARHPAEVMAASNLLGVLAMTLPLLVSGEALSFGRFLLAVEVDQLDQGSPPPPLLFAELLIFSATTYCGVKCYMALVGEFGGVVAVAVSTCRKVVTVALSFALFPKPVGGAHYLAGASLLAGVALQAWGKSKSKGKGKGKAPLATSASNRITARPREEAPAPASISSADPPGPNSDPEAASGNGEAMFQVCQPR